MTEKPYDSRPETWEHIHLVRNYLSDVIVALLARQRQHDQSKLVDPERGVFDEYTPKLRDSTYGSDEYRAFLVGMGEGLQHHYAHNSHHPEHYPEGIDGMDLLDLIEMLADWKAATQRHAGGDLLRSLEINQERFDIQPQLWSVLHNTALRMGWATQDIPNPEEAEGE